MRGKCPRCGHAVELAWRDPVTESDMTKIVVDHRRDSGFGFALIKCEGSGQPVALEEETAQF